MEKDSSKYFTSGVIPYGFRGDPFLLYTVHNLIHQTGITLFVETGTFYGATIRYMGQNYPKLTCYSCEPNEERFLAARSSTAALANCRITQENSPQLLQRLAQTEAVNTPTLFWLDAHGYGFDWPLRQEIEIITNYWREPLILIDDLRVPGHPWFGWDEYGPQECSYGYIQDSIAHRSHQVWYPNYPAKIVTSWPMRGWGLITFDLDRWTPDQWLIARSEIEAATTEAERSAQRAYWNHVLDEIEQLNRSIPPDGLNDIWTRVAQQVPNWFVLEVTRRMSLTSLDDNTTAWTICIQRLASLGEIEQTLSILSHLPLAIAKQRVRTFAEALSPSLRAAAMRYIGEKFSDPSSILASFLEKGRDNG